MLADHAEDIITHIPKGSVVVELGCGTAEKTATLLQALIARWGLPLSLPLQIFWAAWPGKLTPCQGAGLAPQKWRQAAAVNVAAHHAQSATVGTGCSLPHTIWGRERA